MSLVLDLETSSESGDLSDGYALEPWRARQGKGFISSMHVYGIDNSGSQVEINLLRPSRAEVIENLKKLKGQEVYAHYALFDVAWLISSTEPNKLARIPHWMTEIRWRDSVLLAKWVMNGRRADDMYFSYSLLNLINTFKDHLGYPGAEDFIRMKQQEVRSANDPYWAERGQQDVIWTWRLVEFLKTQLPAVCQRGYVIEARSIPQIANSWLIGMYVNTAKLKIAEDKIEQDIEHHCKVLGLSEAILGSPAQLGNVVFGQWGFTPLAKTPTGKPKADADTWILLAHSTGDERLKQVLKARQALTLRSKYIKTTYEALARTGDGFMYGKPMMFGTTSGRLSYGSDTMGMKVSIAQHQIPRKDKLIRDFLSPPPGTKLFETDAAAQESRIMGIWSGDPEIIRIFNTGINFHSYTASHIYGCSYEDFQAHYKAEEARYIEWRQMGKLTNLSCNFRIGGKSLAKKALTEYDTYMSELEGRKLVSTFKRTYSGVEGYWNAIIAYAREHGHSYTLAQRRWKVPVEMLSGADAWKVEGTVISHPIQGTGAEQFYAALSSVPDARIQTNLHDGIFHIVDDSPEGTQEAEHIIHAMNATDYGKLWQMPQGLSIPLLYEESKLGTSYADVK